MTPSAGRPALTAAVLACVAALSAACGSQPGPAGGAPTPANPPSTRSPSPSPSAGTGHTAATGCATSQLSVTVPLNQTGAAAGSTYYSIDFTNVSPSACTLFGYPGVSFVTSKSGSQIGKPATRNPVAAPRLVTLAPHATAHATFQVAEAANYPASQCQPVTAHWLKVYPPNQVTPVTTRLTVQVCSVKKTPAGGRQLAVSAVVNGQGTPH